MHDREYFEKHSKPYDWGVRSYYKKNQWTKSTVWQSEKGQTGRKWWKAQFADGEATVLSVRVMFPWMEKGNWPGVKVYIGDQLCGTVDKDTNWPVDKWIGAIPVECESLVTGDSIRIEMENE